MKVELDEMNVQLDDGAKMPTKAYSTDGGFDIYSREDKVIPARGSAIFNTGVHIELPINTVGVLKSKSGLNVKHNLTSDGLVDYGYNGSIVAKLYNNGDTDYEVKKGDKITQLCIMPIIPLKLKLVDKLVGGERGSNGFGSSGK
jgi:deoxyuridine 5'-triphosphate nucleotidohydrolase